MPDLADRERHLIVRTRPDDLPGHRHTVDADEVGEVVALRHRAERRLDLVASTDQQAARLAEVQTMDAARARASRDDDRLAADPIASDDVQVWAAYPINYSITGLAAVLSNLGPHRWDMPVVLDVSWRTASLVASLVGAALVGTTALLAARAWRSVRGAEQCYAAGATAMLLASPFVWSHMFLVLLWPGATLLRDRGLLGPTVRWIVAGAYLLLSLPDVNLAHAIVDRYAPRPVPVVAVLFFKLPTIGLLTLWAVFCSRARSCTVAQPNST